MAVSHTCMALLSDYAMEWIACFMWQIVLCDFMSVAFSHFWSSEHSEGSRNQSKLLSIYLVVLIACKYIPEHLVLKKCDDFISLNRTMNQETRNCPLRLTHKCVSTCTVPWNISPQALLWKIKLETGNCKPVSQIWQRQHRRNLNAGLKEVSLALMLIHICTIYSPQFVFQPLFLTSRLIQRTGCKTEANNVNSHNARKLCTTDLWQMH